MIRKNVSKGYVYKMFVYVCVYAYLSFLFLFISVASSLGSVIFQSSATCAASLPPTDEAARASESYGI